MKSLIHNIHVIYTIYYIYLFYYYVIENIKHTTTGSNKKI